MKRLFALIMTLALVLGTAACDSPEQKPAETTAESTAATVATTGETTAASTEPSELLPPDGEGFRVGFGRAIITPEENLPLGGYGTSNTRIMNDVLDDTYVTCIAMTDEKDYTVLLMLVDLQRIEDVLIDVLQLAVMTETGIPEDNIIISCSHTHSIPDLTLDEHEGIQRYKVLLAKRFAQAARQALEDSKPATMSVGSIDAPGMNFVKHYQYTDAEGNTQFFGDNFGVATINETTHHVTDPYNAMHILKFTREGGKDVVLTNFRAHPTMTGGADIRDLSSDFVGPLRDAMETELDCHFAFMQGACGNINPRSRISSENFGAERNHVEYGYRLAKLALTCLEENMEEAETGIIQSQKILYDAKVDHSGDNLIAYAKLVKQYWQDSGRDHAVTNAFGRPYGVSSVFHANAIITKSKLPQTQQIELNVFSIGNSAGFFSAPGELFDQFSVDMEAASPFQKTFTVGFTNGDWKYFPYGVCAEYKSYESDYGRFEVGTTAEEMIALWTETLQQFYNNAK